MKLPQAPVIVHCDVPIPSMPQPRPRVGKGRAYYSERFTAWRDKVALYLRSEWTRQGRIQPVPPIGVVLEFRGPKRGDLDNHVKAWLDALADAIGIDDRHITDLHARWRTDGEPGVWVCVFHDGCAEVGSE
jgi:Holliday junction resolvase RusA-like endonuclease